MDVFISWSGERSRAAAEALREWLPQVINAIEPWLSSADIDKGSRWATELSTRLEVSKAGIVCLTPSNLRAEWVLFEAGALSKTIKNTFVCPLLIDLKPADVKGPLAQFQAVKAGDKKDVWGLIQTLNTAQEKGLSERRLEAAFEIWWPKLEQQFKSLPSDDSKTKSHRPDRELLEEILVLVRNQSRPDTVPQLSSGNVRGPLSEKVRDYMLRQEITNALEANGERGYRIEKSSHLLTQDDVYFVHTKSGGSLKILLPADSHLEGAITHAKIQVNRYFEGLQQGNVAARQESETGDS